MPVLVGVLALSAVVLAPQRHRRLANDTSNIDDVQVAVGRRLAGAGRSDVVWAIDAGAVRYFGAAYVVDVMGLNTPQMLGGHAQSFLAAHPPRYLEYVPGWATLDGLPEDALRGWKFEPSRPYTVTSFAPMQRHWLLRCAPGGMSGRLTVKRGSFKFTCAPDGVHANRSDGAA